MSRHLKPGDPSPVCLFCMYHVVCASDWKYMETSQQDRKVLDHYLAAVMAKWTCRSCIFLLMRINYCNHWPTYGWTMEAFNHFPYVIHSSSWHVGWFVNVRHNDARDVYLWRKFSRWRIRCRLATSCSSKIRCLFRRFMQQNKSCYRDPNKIDRSMLFEWSLAFFKPIGKTPEKTKEGESLKSW